MGFSGFIPWRTRLMDGGPTMIGYTGGDDIYDQSGEALPHLHVKWLQSDDGLNLDGETVWTAISTSPSPMTHSSP